MCFLGGLSELAAYSYSSMILVKFKLVYPEISFDIAPLIVASIGRSSLILMKIKLPLLTKTSTKSKDKILM